MCACVYLNGGGIREGIQMVRKARVEDNQLPEGSTGEDSLHGLDGVLDDGGGSYGCFPTFFFG